MVEDPKPTDEQVDASVRDAIRKLTEPASPPPEDGVGPEGRDDLGEPGAEPRPDRT